MLLPSAIPEIPVARTNLAVDYYLNHLGFVLDWGNNEDGIAGISKGKCCLILTDTAFRKGWGNSGPVLFWLNLTSKAEVDQLFTEWKTAGAKIIAEPEDKPWMLHEFIAADLDGNLIRIFYDFRRDA